MTKHNTLAFILNRQAYREEDSLVTVYTELYGKLSLVARGTQKLKSKLAGHIEPFSLAEIMIIPGKGYDYLGSALNRNLYLGIRRDLNKLYYLGQAFKIFNRLVSNNQADQKLFSLLQEYLKILDSLDSQKKNSEAQELSREIGQLTLSIFILKFLQEAGYQPEVYQCLECHQDIKPGKNYFSFRDGGLICESCFLEKFSKFEDRNFDTIHKNDYDNQSILENKNFSLTITNNCVRLIRDINNNNFEQILKLKISKKLIRELFFLVNKFIEFCP